MVNPVSGQEVVVQLEQEVAKENAALNKNSENAALNKKSENTALNKYVQSFMKKTGDYSLKKKQAGIAEYRKYFGPKYKESNLQHITNGEIKNLYKTNVANWYSGKPMNNSTLKLIKHLTANAKKLDNGSAISLNNLISRIVINKAVTNGNISTKVNELNSLATKNQTNTIIIKNIRHILDINSMRVLQPLIKKQ